MESAGILITLELHDKLTTDKQLVFRDGRFVLQQAIENGSYVFSLLIYKYQ